MSATISSPQLSHALTWEGWSPIDVIDALDLPPTGKRLSQVSVKLPSGLIRRFNLWELVEMDISPNPPSEGPEIVINGYLDSARDRPIWRGYVLRGDDSDALKPPVKFGAIRRP